MLLRRSSLDFSSKLEGNFLIKESVVGGGGESRLESDELLKERRLSGGEFAIGEPPQEDNGEEIEIEEEEEEEKEGEEERDEFPED